MKRFFFTCFFASVYTLGHSQSILTYTEQNMGYSIPEPQESLTPIEGFRSYQSLQAQYLNLAMEHEFITRRETGQSVQGRPIYSYIVDRGDGTTPEGIDKSAIGFQGAIHAREWASPEALMTIYEWLTTDNNDALRDYILDHAEIVFHPMANPDGYLQTQRYFDQVVFDGRERDGRNRRKNMADVDERLMTFDDYQLGVDLNRNHTLGWTAGDNITSTSYKGPSPLSEPESNALYDALDLIDTDRLRLYIDFHSAQNVYYVSRDFESGYDDAALEVVNLMDSAIFAETGSVQNNPIDVDTFNNSPTSFDDPIGATDENVASRYGCLSYTAELPVPKVATRNIFVMPNNEVDAMRREQLAATKSALYYTMGPATIVAVDINDEAGTLVYSDKRLYNPSTGQRDLSINHNGALRRGADYTVILRFNKPLRLGLNGPEALPGAQAKDIAGELAGIPMTQAKYLLNDVERYAMDSVSFSLSIPEDTLPGSYTISISGTDAAGLPVDGDSASVADWSRFGWVSQETTPDSLTEISITESIENVGDGFVVR